MHFCSGIIDILGHVFLPAPCTGTRERPQGAKNLAFWQDFARKFEILRRFALPYGEDVPFGNDIENRWAALSNPTL